MTFDTDSSVNVSDASDWNEVHDIRQTMTRRIHSIVQIGAVQQLRGEDVQQRSSVIGCWRSLCLTKSLW